MALSAVAIVSVSVSNVYTTAGSASSELPQATKLIIPTA